MTDESPMYGKVDLPTDHAEQARAMAGEVIATIPAVWQTLTIKIREKGQTEWRDAEIMIPVAAPPE
jgi:hypothetical protein